MEGLPELMEMFPDRSTDELRATLSVSNDLTEAIDRLVSIDNLRRTLDNSFNLNGPINKPVPEDVPKRSVEIIDITSSPPSHPGSSPPRPQASHGTVKTALSEDSVLANVLAMFPDVDHQHVRNMYKERKLQGVDDILGAIVEKLLDSGSDYPKQEKASGKKRKRSPSNEANETHPYMANDRKDADAHYTTQAIMILKINFPRVPDTYIRTAFAKNRHFLAPTYLAIAKAEATYDERRPNEFVRLRSLRYQHRGKQPYFNKEILDELEFAKTKFREMKRQRQEEEDAKFAASLNYKEQEDSGQLMECQCCFGDEQFSKMTQCREGHLFCLDCAKNYASAQVGQGKYQLNCMDGSGCKAEFPRTEIMRFVDDKMLLALDKLQQEAELRLADMDDLETCPFCEFAAILGPIEEDKEFRCENSECGEVSCRLCKEKSHIPKTCEEFKRENTTLNARHAVEEAMTAAMVRTCNKCANKFIKESGCNKMTCTRCGSLQCYVCSQTIKDYNHFQGRGANGKCPLYDNHEARHEEERKRAAEAVVAQLAQKDPTITAKDVEIKLSDEAKRAEAERLQRVAQVHQGAGVAFDFNANAQNLYFPPNVNGGQNLYVYNPAAIHQQNANQLFPGMPAVGLAGAQQGILGNLGNPFAAFPAGRQANQPQLPGIQRPAYLDRLQQQHQQLLDAHNQAMQINMRGLEEARQRLAQGRRPALNGNRGNRRAHAVYNPAAPNPAPANPINANANGAGLGMPAPRQYNFGGYNPQARNN